MGITSLLALISRQRDTSSPWVSLLPLVTSPRALALEAAGLLAAEGHRLRVVSLPCWEAFFAQDEDYRRSVLGEGLPVASLEAGSTFGWERVVGAGGLGQRIHVAISLFLERELLTLILAVYAMVTLVDALSAYLRRRVI